MKKTIKNYCFTSTQKKLNELYKIAIRYTSVKNEIFQRYGSISGLQYLSYPRQIRDNWVKTGFAGKFGLQARYWKQAFDEGFSNIRSNWSNGFSRAKDNLYKNKDYTEVEKHYAFYLLKSPIRRFAGRKPHQHRQGSFLIDENMYDVKTDNKDRLWLSIMGLKPRKRIRLLMTSTEPLSGSLRIVLKDKRIEVHQAVEVEAKEFIKGEARAVDKGFSEVITSSSGRKYGAGFNEKLKAESYRLSGKNKKGNKLRALTDKYEKKGDIVKTEIIKKNNLGKKKYFHQKE